MVFLVRHGETEWSRVKRHTGRTDIPLTEIGREQARAAGARLGGREFALALTSPLQRARDTAALAGFPDAIEDPDLMEWDYGAFEGLRTREIRAERPGWEIWREGVPEGETLDDLAARADRVIERLLAVDGDALVFAHGHLLRVLGARWIGLPPSAGGHFVLATAAICELGFEREKRAIAGWNVR